MTESRETRRALFDRAPQQVPHPLIPDGPLLGNGDIGVCVAAAPSGVRLWIAKSNFWRSEPLYPRGGPRPFGWVDIEVAGLEAATWTAELDLDTATLVVRRDAEYGSAQFTIWVAATQPVVVVEVVAEGEARVTSRVVARPGGGAVVDGGQVDGDAWASRSFCDDAVLWPATMRGRQWVAGAQADTDTPAGSTTVVTGFGCDHGGDEPTAAEACADALRAVEELGMRGLRAAHVAWWRSHWEASDVQLADVEVERFYRGAQYLLASCSRNREFPPGLYGVWVTSDEPEWAGDYHLNYNYEAAWWGSLAANHVEVNDPYDAPILDYLPRGLRYARDLLDCDGAYYDVGIGPRGYCSSYEPWGPAFLGQRTNASFAALNMIARHRYMLDADYARLVLPFLGAAADFWVDYLSDDGERLVDHDDALIESGDGPEFKEQADTNNVLALGLIRSVLDGAVEVASFLDVEYERSARWATSRARLSALPTRVEDGELRLLGSETGLSAGPVNPNNVRLLVQAMLYPLSIFPGRDEPLLDALRRELTAIPDEVWIHATNGFDSVFPGAARAGLPPELLLARLHAKLSAHGQDNLWIYQAGGGIETIGGIQGVVTEMLLQDWDGVVRVFPGWPRTVDASFRSLRTQGGQLLTAELRDGDVRSVSVWAERGGHMRMANPWHERSDAAALILVGDCAPEVVAAPCLTVHLAAGQTATITPVAR